MGLASCLQGKKFRQDLEAEDLIRLMGLFVRLTRSQLLVDVISGEVRALSIANLHGTQLRTWTIGQEF